jgi:hypothetical protein
VLKLERTSEVTFPTPSMNMTLRERHRDRPLHCLGLLQASDLRTLTQLWGKGHLGNLHLRITQTLSLPHF